MLENVLAQKLNPKYREKGFALSEQEDAVMLTRNGKLIQRFDSKVVTARTIDLYIKSEILINPVANEEL